MLSLGTSNRGFLGKFWGKTGRETKSTFWGACAPPGFRRGMVGSGDDLVGVALTRHAVARTYNLMSFCARTAVR